MIGLGCTVGAGLLVATKAGKLGLGVVAGVIGLGCAVGVGLRGRQAWAWSGRHRAAGCYRGRQAFEDAQAACVLVSGMVITAGAKGPASMLASGMAITAGAEGGAAEGDPPEDAGVVAAGDGDDVKVDLDCMWRDTNSRDNPCAQFKVSRMHFKPGHMRVCTTCACVSVS